MNHPQTEPALDPDGHYSLENARRHRWASVTGEFQPERLRTVEDHLVDGSVLDAGCGGGGWVDRLADANRLVLGVDRHMQFLEQTANEKRHGKFVNACITQLPFQEQTFDNTICLDVLEHVDDVAALREIIRVTRRRVIVTVPKANELQRFAVTFLTYTDPTHLRYYTEDSLAELITSCCPQASFRIFGEMPLPSRALAMHLLGEQPIKKGRRLRLAERLLGPLTGDTLIDAIDRLGGVDESNTRRVDTNLAAVIDLCPK